MFCDDKQTIYDPYKSSEILSVCEMCVKWSYLLCVDYNIMNIISHGGYEVSVCSVSILALV